MDDVSGSPSQRFERRSLLWEVGYEDITMATSIAAFRRFMIPYNLP
jgi:hypothetical protein